MSLHDRSRVESLAERTRTDYKYRGDVGYLHTRRDRGYNLYAAVRGRLGLSQRAAAEQIGITQRAWQYRERGKRLYVLSEIVLLQALSGMSGDEFVEFLNDIA